MATREQTAEMIKELEYRLEVMRHFQGGGKVQGRPKICRNFIGKWEDVSEKFPIWDFDNGEYRIKPKPVERWFCEYRCHEFNTSLSQANHETESEAKKFGVDLFGERFLRAVRFVQVEDES